MYLSSFSLNSAYTRYDSILLYMYLSLILNKYLLYLFIINLNRLSPIKVLNAIHLIIKNLNIQHKSK